ncbi:protein NO VEIN domain-containing protein [Mucilaginibacter sp.]
MDFINWTDTEVELIVADYFAMLVDELKGLKINKTDHRNAILPLLNNRGKGSVEYKHQNISAVLAEMGLPFIDGYKPAYNFQKSKLIRIVDMYIRAHMGMETLFQKFSDTSPEIINPVNFSSWMVPAPEIKDEKQKINLTRKPIKVNYLQREQDNRSLGLKGEQLVFEYEKSSLLNFGKSSLADKVEWVSRDLGDGLGFDILSKNLDGTDKYIEVKTTKLSKETPFYFSSNEYNVSIEHGVNYHLYRIFDFIKIPKIFMLNGQFDAFCRMEPTNYIGKF